MNAKKLISILLCLCMMTGLLVIAAHAANPTITFDNTSKRTVLKNEQQVWVENGITVTNDKAASTNNVADYSNPIRLYKGSSLTVSYSQNIEKIIFTCGTYKDKDYPTDLKNSITSGSVVVDGVVVTVTLDTPATSYTIGAMANQVRLLSIEIVPGAGGSGSVTPEPDPTPEVDATAKAILDAAYALAEGEEMAEDVSLTGKVTKIDTPYSEQWNNISVTIEVPGAAEQPILCYRLSGDDVNKIAVGDTITVTGRIKNHYGTIEFGQGCSMDDRIPGENEVPVAPEDPKQIVDAAFALEKGASLPYEATLTGTITEIVTEYSADYKNITVNIEVEGTDGKKIIECYRMKGEGADALAVGDVISVTGQLTRYCKAATDEKPELDKIEFNSGCTFVPATGEGDGEGEGEGSGDDTGDVTVPENAKDILDAAYALPAGEALPYEATLTGKVVSIDTEYNEQYDNVTVTIVIEGCEDQPIQCFRLKGNGADELLVDDVITVTGKIINYNGKVQFDAGSTFVYGDGEQSPVTADMPMIAFVILAVLCATTAVVLVSSKKKMF